jgi:prepilin-type N-terminal cleavage/methylation domain-containing protein
MRSNRPRREAGRGPAGFTLAEILAALVLMAIVIPIALEGMNVVSRAAILGERKAIALRVAERVLNEQIALIAPGQEVPGSGSGVEADGDMTYPWTMETEPWPVDAMTQATVHVTFIVRGTPEDVSVSTLFDPNAGALTTSAGGAATPGSGS